MKLKIPLLAIAATLAFNSSFAQDILYKNDGNNEEVKIIEVGTRTVIYKKWNNQDGPDFIISKNEIYKIKFKNGDEEMFAKSTPRHGGINTIKIREKRSNDVYGNNILTVSPVHMTNTSATGFGIGYEHVIGKNNMVSFYLPICLSYHDNNDNTYSPLSNGATGRSTMIWIMPGLKLYPTGSNGIVRYGVGPSLAFATGSREIVSTTYNQAGQAQTTTTNPSVFIMGILINNSLNIQATEHFRIGLELGLGIPYYKNDAASGTYSGSYYYSSPYNNTPLVQFNFNVGYRF